MTYKPLYLEDLDVYLNVYEDGQIEMNGKMLNQHLVERYNTRYWVVYIKRKTRYVHTLVPKAWCGNPMPERLTRPLHINGNTLHNHYTNFMWVTPEYLAHTVRAKTLQNPNYRSDSKLTAQDCYTIMERIDKGDSYSAIAKDYEVEQSTIRRVKKRKIYAKTNSYE